MADDSLQHLQLESLNFHVEGMESVVATVTGYHGSERFNLIKLISHTGASYIGNMNPSVTHLVCWKFEGRKYELAKKLKMEIVNHRWIEECVKKGRRVSERPYTFQSGKEVGPLLLDPPSGINISKSQWEALKKSKQPVVDIDCEDTNNDASWSNTVLVDELEETGPSQPTISSRVKRKTSTSLKSQGKARRLVKKHINKKDELSSSEVLEGLDEGKVLTRNTSSINLSDSSGSERHHPLTDKSRQDNTDARDDVEEIQHANNENRNTSNFSVSSLRPPTSEEQTEAACVDSTDVGASKKMPAPKEPSCIICLTDFSPTRGVLPCGHRFCFHCIQNWADHMSLTGKLSTCPLCKASFTCIIQDATVSSDQKMYSQSIPHGGSSNLYVLPDEGHVPYNLLNNASVCCECSSREPEDLLVKCHSCGIRCVHCYCLDPPLFPWICVACKESPFARLIRGP